MKLIVKDGICLNREDEHFEAKSAQRGIPESMWESYSAFANTDGGTIVLGLDENEDGTFTVSGVKNAHQIKSELWNSLNNVQKVNKNVLRSSDITVESFDDKDIVIMNVPAARIYERPVFFKNISHTFKRNGSGDYRCTSDEIGGMFRDSSTDSFDMTPVRFATMEDLDQDSIAEYTNLMKLHYPGSLWLKYPQEDFLRAIGAARRIDGKLVPTLAGILMFGRFDTIRLELPNYSLDYYEFEKGGDEWTFRRNSGSPMWSGNLFDFYTTVVNRLSLQIKKDFKVPDGISRDEDTELNRAAREAVTNAVVNADYGGRRGIKIQLRPEKMVVENPGLFRVPIRKAEEGGISDPRNKALMELFTYISRAEKAGTGVKRIIEACRNNGLDEPTFDQSMDPETTTVTIRFDEGLPEISEVGEEILFRMGSDPKVTAKTLSEKIGVPMNGIVKEINILKSIGRLERVGGSRGMWVVLDPRE